MKLQNLCLTVIVESIDRFNNVYSTTHNEVLRRGFRLLQKAYSRELLVQLSGEELLQERYADMVFNNYLTFLETCRICKFSWRSIVKIFARIGPGLEEVEFIENFHFGHEQPWEKVVRYLPNVKRICYLSTMRNANIFRRIAEHCPKLEILIVNDARNDDIANEGLACFIPRKNVKKINYFQRRATSLPLELTCPLFRDISMRAYIHDLRIDDTIGQVLDSLPSLEIIEYSRLPDVLYKKHKHDMFSPDQVKRYSLTHLDLIESAQNYRYYYEDDNFADVLKVCFTVCPNLKKVSCEIHSSEHLNLCFLLNSVEDLTLYCEGVPRINVSDFLTEKGGKLTSLGLSLCTVSLSALRQCCLTLNSLSLLKVSIQWDAQEDIPIFNTLTSFEADHLSFSNSENCEGIYCILRSAPALTSLHIRSCKGFTSETLCAISKCCEQCPLDTIILDVPCVETKFLKDILFTCRTLKTFNLTFTFGIAPAEIEKDLCCIAQTLTNRPTTPVIYRYEFDCGLCSRYN